MSKSRKPPTGKPKTKKAPKARKGREPDSEVPLALTKRGYRRGAGRPTKEQKAAAPKEKLITWRNRDKLQDPRGPKTDIPDSTVSNVIDINKSLGNLNKPRKPNVDRAAKEQRLLQNSKAGSEAHNGWHRHPSINERVSFIMSLIQTGSFVRGATPLALAEEWGVTVSCVNQHVFEAHRALDREESGLAEKGVETKRRYIAMLERTAQEALTMKPPDYKASERCLKLAADMQGLIDRNTEAKLSAMIARICEVIEEVIGKEGVELVARRLQEDEEANGRRDNQGRYG